MASELRSRKNPENAEDPKGELSLTSSTPALAAESAEPGVADVLHERFEAFWLPYPRKTQNEMAWRLFAKIASGEHEHRATADTMVMGSEAYAAKRPDPEYAPSPVRWLAEARWNDQNLTAWSKHKAEEEAIRLCEETQLAAQSEKYGIPIDELRNDPHAILRHIEEFKSRERTRRSARPRLNSIVKWLKGP